MVFATGNVQSVVGKIRHIYSYSKMSAISLLDVPAFSYFLLSVAQEMYIVGSEEIAAKLFLF